MIVREEGPSLWLVTQPDHAALAADLMQAWVADGLPERSTREAVLFATSVHDVGWTGFDASPTVDTGTGRPIDFMNAPVETKQAVWWKALEVLPGQSTYAAALVAQHALTIYRRFRGDPAWRAFFAGMERERDRWFTTDLRPDGTSGGPLDPEASTRRSFLLDYATVATGDLLSLTFCNGWTEPQMTEGYQVQLDGSVLRVTPDPFGGQRIPFRVRARRIPNTRYEDAARLRQAVGEATEEFLEGDAMGG